MVKKLYEDQTSPVLRFSGTFLTILFHEEELFKPIEGCKAETQPLVFISYYDNFFHSQ